MAADSASNAQAQPWPTELRLAKDRKRLTVSFDTGESFPLDAEYLRVMSPSAEVQGHSPEERKVQPGKRHVAEAKQRRTASGALISHGARVSGVRTRRQQSRTLGGPRLLAALA